MIEIHTPSGKVYRSRNLRGILDYARRSPVKHVRMYLSQACNATLSVVFDDGAGCITKFADYSVMRDWVKARRSWHAEVEDCHPYYAPW